MIASTMVRRADVDAVLRAFGFDALEVALARRSLGIELLALRRANLRDLRALAFRQSDALEQQPVRATTAAPAFHLAMLGAAPPLHPLPARRVRRLCDRGAGD